MSVLVDVLAIALLAAAAASFATGLQAMGAKDDLGAIYWFAMGALLLRSATDLLRPRRRSAS